LLAAAFGLRADAPRAPQAAGDAVHVIYFPEVDVGERQLEARRKAQLREAAAIGVEHDFRLRDRQPESGITFRHRITEDGGKYYKPVHYDHGNGLAVADVDGDGRPDLYFVNQLGSNELWHNKGDGTFEDWTARAGVGLAERVGVTASFADYDNDGDPDLFVTTVRMGNALFNNDGSGRFTDVTEAAGLTYSGHSSGAVFFDYDRDGLLDLFLTNVGKYTTDKLGPGPYYVGYANAFDGHLFPERTETSILYRNLDGKRFADVSRATGLADDGWAGDAAFADLDQDGYPDLYVLNMQGDDRYYANLAGERFVERTAEYFPKTPWGSMGIKFFDYDNDGRLDLILTDMHSDMSIEVDPPGERLKSIMMWPEEKLQGSADNIFGNAFYRNPGKPPFVELSDDLKTENYWPWGVSVGDLNADGWEDVFITASMNYPFRYGINSLLLNDRGKVFAHSEFILGVEPRRDGRTKVPWFELDCSSDVERADPTLNRMCGDRRGKWTVYGNLGSRTSAFVDLEGDGDLDLVTGELNAEPQVLVSDLAQRRPLRYLSIRLVGGRSNRDGLGAVVKVHTERRVLTRQHDGKSGYLSQSSQPLYVGLGDERPTAIEVLWPSGIRQSVKEGIPDAGPLTLREPDAPGAP